MIAGSDPGDFYTSVTVGFRISQHAHRPRLASLPVPVRTVVPLLHASFTAPVTLGVLRFTTVVCHFIGLSPFFYQVIAHAGRTRVDIPVVLGGGRLSKDSRRCKRWTGMSTLLDSHDPPPTPHGTGKNKIPAPISSFPAEPGRALWMRAVAGLDPRE